MYFCAPLGIIEAEILLLSVMRQYRFILIVGTMFLLLSACKNDNNQTTKPKTVKTEEVIFSDETLEMQYPGRVKSSQDASLSFKVNGTLQRILVIDGQRVKKGQLIAELDPIDYQVQFDATEAEYKQIKAEAERIIALYKDGGTTPNNYDKAVYGLKQITAKYQHHKDQLSYTKLYAPYDGIVEKHYFEEHEIVGAGMPVLNLVGAATPEVEISLPAQDFVKREMFRSYTCTFDVYPGIVYKLEPKSISPKANANQLYSMIFKLVAEGNPMPSVGMNTMVTIASTQGGDVETYVVPSTAVFDTDGVSRVFVYDANSSTVKAVEVNVTFLKNNGKSEVTSTSLKRGDLVVSSGVHHINDGEAVRLIPTTSKTNVGGLL